MTTGPDRKALHAFVSDGAHEAWRDLSVGEGISVSVLLECVSGMLADRPAQTSKTFDEAFEDLVKSSRRLDAPRRHPD